MQSSAGRYHAFLETIPLALASFRESTAGDVGNAAANGGLLASDTTPVLSGSGATVSQQLSWAAGNTDQVLVEVGLPEDFDGRDNVLVELWVSSGTADAASFTVATSWDGAADVTDTASDAATKSATVHKITAVIDKADVPDKPSFMTLALTPAAHATDAIVLKAVKVRHFSRGVEG